LDWWGESAQLWDAPPAGEHRAERVVDDRADDGAADLAVAGILAGRT